MAMRTRMSSERQERCWTKGSWRRQEQNTVQQERAEVYAALQYAASFHCLVKEQKDFEELKPQPKEQWTCGQAKRGNTASNGMVCFSVSKYRCLKMWKRQQVHEDGRSMYRVEKPGNFVGRNVEKTKYGRTRYGKKNGQAWRSFDLVQKMLWLHTTENGTKTDELLQTGEGGTTEDGKMLKRIQVR